MTNREFYLAVIEGNYDPDLVAKATELVEKLDARNAKRASVPSKATKENIENRAKVVEVLKGADHPMTASEISAITGFSIQKVGSLITGKNGIDNVVKTQVKSATGKGKVNAYSLA